MTDSYSKNNAIVIGHKNPDTDSVCTAIAYAHLKNMLGHKCEPRRAGRLNSETAFVLNYFGVKTPALFMDARPQVFDVDIRAIDPIDEEMSVRDVWSRMTSEDVSTLCVVNDDGSLKGLITVNDIANANMDVFDSHILAESRTSYRNILSTLNGTMLVGDPDAHIEKGGIFVGAASPEAMEEFVSKGDIVLVSNRLEAQMYAISLGASCIIVCCGKDVSKYVISMAKDQGCTIITTDYDTYAAARTITHAAPIRHFMVCDNIRAFNMATPLEEVRSTMVSVRHRYFPVIDANNRYCGLISRRNVLNNRRKQMILVDHNEISQAVDGLEEANILEIIDHHRIGSIQTMGPVYFRNMPVGCTGTIVTIMYEENDIEIPKDMAGLMLSAILSDTLMFRSPTSTSLDEKMAYKLADIAGVKLEEYAEKMFEAGEDFSGKTPEEIFKSDFKVFEHGDIKFGVGQSVFMSESNLKRTIGMLEPYIRENFDSLNISMVYYLFTNVMTDTSEMICAGKNTDKVVHKAFATDVTDGHAILDGVVSRKKQFIPPVMNALNQIEN